MLQPENYARLRAVGQVMQAKECSVRLETLAGIMELSQNEKILRQLFRASEAEFGAKMWKTYRIFAI